MERINSRKMKNFMDTIFPAFVFLTFLNVVLTGISSDSHITEGFCLFKYASPSVIISRIFLQSLAPSLHWYDLWKYHSKPHHEKGFLCLIR